MVSCTLRLGDRVIVRFCGERLVGEIVAMTPQLCVVSIVRVIALGKYSRATSYAPGEHIAVEWETVFALVDPPKEAIGQLTTRTSSQVIYRTTDEAPKIIKRLRGILPYSGQKSGPCVYFLCLLGELVYVGSTSDLITRVGDHKFIKTFDAVFWMPIGLGRDMREVERFYIGKFQPPYNRIGVHGSERRRVKHVPIISALPLPATPESEAAR